jgi:hypothetical protein
MKRTLIALSSFLALSGCALGPYAPDYGDATRNNIAVESVQPAPPPVAQPVPGNGAVAALAQDRYATDKVKQPVAVSTSSVGSGNSGGSGSSGQ